MRLHTLPASLKKIGTAAFQGCTKLTSIALPDGFTTLGEHAFDGCSGLKTVTFGQSLTDVPAYAFSNCSALTAVDLPATVETVGDYAFRGCSKATALSLKEGLTSIGSNAFYGWKALKAITIPQSVTSLGGSAFYDCNAAASIDCGSLTVIPDRAFYNAKAVKTVKLSDNVTSIGERAFYSCSLLETINWPSQLKTIGKQAFYYARKLQNLDFSGTQLESIGNSAFYQPYEARTLAFPDTLQSIDSKAFAYLNYNKTAYVTEVNIPASVTSLAKDAFYLASGLKNIVVDVNNPVYASSNGVVMLKDTGDIYIWPQGNETTEFTLPATMTEIPDKMFQNNTSLKKVIVPASVTKVGSYAFSSSKIEEIYFEDSANGLTVGTFAFYNCPNLTSLRLPYGLTSIGANAISKTGLETIVIPDTVTEMGGSALAYNDNLKNVTLSKSMTAVPSRGFVGCESLTELTLPASIQDCGVTDTSVAFNDCTSLQNIYVADGSLYFKSVDGVLFDKNGANLRYYPEGRTAESYRIPEGTIRVGGNAFAGNLFLKSVSYPTTLERIGTKAFFGCENLKDYYFNGMTAPLLETTVSLTGAYANVALYANFVGLWGTTGTGGFVYNDWGLNLYYPQGAEGYTAYVWDKYFNTEKGSVNIMDESYFTPTDLTVTETGVRNALLTWTAAKQSNAEDIVYKVERSVAAHFQDDTQDTWTFEGFETLAEGLTACTYTDTTTLPFGRSYAYRVTAYSLTGETGPAAIGYLYIDADPNNADEMAVLELIKKIEALKPIENLTNEDEAYLRQLLAEYNALTDAQKELVYNYATLLAALEKAGHNPELKNAKPATCTEDGYTGDEVCKVCGEVITKGQLSRQYNGSHQRIGRPAEHAHQTHCSRKARREPQQRPHHAAKRCADVKTRHHFAALEAHAQGQHRKHHFAHKVPRQSLLQLNGIHNDIHAGTVIAAHTHQVGQRHHSRTACSSPHPRIRQQFGDLMLKKVQHLAENHRHHRAAHGQHGGAHHRPGIQRRRFHHKPCGRNAGLQRDAVCNKRRQKARHEGHGQHQAHIHHHHRKQGRGQRCTEQRRKKCRHAAHGSRAAVMIVEVQHPADIPADAAAHLQRCALAAGRAAAQMGEHSAQKDGRDQPRRHRAAVLHGPQHIVGALADTARRLIQSRDGDARRRQKP